jgi:hypothetical protein
MNLTVSHQDPLPFTKEDLKTLRVLAKIAKTGAEGLRASKLKRVVVKAFKEQQLIVEEEGFIWLSPYGNRTKDWLHAREENRG